LLPDGATAQVYADKIKFTIKDGETATISFSGTFTYEMLKTFSVYFDNVHDFMNGT
jgi:ketol-acid reductoisomerase